MTSRGFNWKGIPTSMLSDQFLFAGPCQLKLALRAPVCMMGKISFPLGLWTQLSFFKGLIIQCLMCEYSSIVRLGAKHVGQEMHLS